MKRLLSVSLFALSALFPSLRAQPAPAAEPVVELPKFVVTDSRELPPPEAWRYGTIPGFEILTNASDKATRRLINDFEIFRMALGYVWPMPARPAGPTALIISGRKGKFDAFIPPGKPGDPSLARASLFLKDGTRSAIVLDFETSVLNVLSVEVDDPAAGSDSSRFEVDHNKQLYREYVHFLLGRAEPRLPAWFEEGMAQIIMAMKVDRKYIEFGRVEDPNLVSVEAAQVAATNAAAAADDPDAPMLAGAPVEDRDFNAALQRKALVPLDRFFAMSHDAPEAVNPLGNNRWAKQAYAFVHMGLFGENGRYQKPFSQFLSRVARGEAVTEPMFKECFKMSYKDMLLQIRSYCDFTSYTSKEFRAKGEGLPLPPPLELRDATQSEVGRIKGETLVLAGRKDAARAELIAPYIRGERDPALLAALGLFEHNAGQDERARKFLDAAVAGKVVRPEAYLELARLRFNDAVAKPASGDRFSAAQASGIAEPLLIARRQPPLLPGVYELLAETWLRSPSPTKEEVSVLADGVRLFPGRMKLIYQTAVLFSAAGMIEAAHSLVDHGIAYGPDATVKARFQQLKASLPPDPNPPAAGAKAAPAAPAAAK